MLDTVGLLNIFWNLWYFFQDLLTNKKLSIYSKQKSFLTIYTAVSASLKSVHFFLNTFLKRLIKVIVKTYIVRKYLTGVMADENSALHHRSKLYFKVYSNRKIYILNCNNISQYYCFFLYFWSDIAALMRIREVFKNNITILNITDPKLHTIIATFD